MKLQKSVLKTISYPFENRTENSAFLSKIFKMAPNTVKLHKIRNNSGVVSLRTNVNKLPFISSVKFKKKRANK